MAPHSRTVQVLSDQDKTADQHQQGTPEQRCVQWAQQIVPL